MKIIFFSPHSAIWIHAFPEALVAEALAQESNDIVYVTCGGCFSDYCVAMSAYGLKSNASPGDKARICRRCSGNRDVLRRSFNLRGYDLYEVLDPKAITEVDKLIELHRFDALCLVIDGLPIGRIAAYEFLLNRKKSSLTLSEEERQEHGVALRNTLLSYFACKKIFEMEKPDRVVMYNSLYSVNRVCALLADKLGIPSLFLHAGGNISRRLSTLMIGRNNTLAALRYNVNQWGRFSEIPCEKSALSKVTDHFIELFSGQSVFAYSSEKGGAYGAVREKLGISENRKVLVATMSSYDERFAAEVVGVTDEDGSLTFKTQLEWISALVEYVRPRPNLFLVIRVHPREFPNKREAVKSEHAQQLEKSFVELPPNVRVNWPSDKLSLYDLAEVTDVFLNAWSSVGKEMSLLGLPVVIYSPQLLLYPADLTFVGTTRETYFQAIEAALADGWSAERIRKAYRWHVLEFERAVADISDSYQEKENVPRSLASRVARTIRRKVSPHYEQIRDCRNRAGSLEEKKIIIDVIEGRRPSVLAVRSERQSPGVSFANETQYLRGEVKRLVDALCRGRSHAEQSGLIKKLHAFACPARQEELSC
jgi:hypothetical protein